jgi:inner membrane protein
MTISGLSGISPEILWTLMGIAFVFVEFIIPGFVIAFFGAGALITALTTWIGVTPGLSGQLIVFMVSSILLLLLLRKFMKKTFLGNSKQLDTNRIVNIEIGRIVPVIEFIQPGEVGGKVRFQGTNWSARAKESVAPGESVKITGCDNLTLLVEKIKTND